MCHSDLFRVGTVSIFRDQMSLEGHFAHTQFELIIIRYDAFVVANFAHTQFELMTIRYDAFVVAPLEKWFI